MLTAAGVEVEVRKVHIRSEAEARSWRFVSSPTVRINGIDIAFELRESSCGSEACVDGCGDQIACRVWMFGGREYTEPPVELIVDAILHDVYGAPAGADPLQQYEVPENLRRFSSQASRRRRSCRGRGADRVSRARVLFGGGGGELLRRLGEVGLSPAPPAKAVAVGDDRQPG